MDDDTPNEIIIEDDIAKIVLYDFLFEYLSYNSTSLKCTSVYTSIITYLLKKEKKKDLIFEV